MKLHAPDPFATDDRRNLEGAGHNDFLEVLAEPRDGVSDTEGLELAQRIIYPAAASHLVARLGSIRDEKKRERMVAITSGLGREMAMALSDALGEARDRYQRRSFLDALSAQGEEIEAPGEAIGLGAVRQQRTDPFEMRSHLVLG